MGSVLIIFGNCCLPHAAWLVHQPSNPSASSVHHGGCSCWQGQAAQLFRLRRAASFCWMVTPVGLEPTIPGSVGRCLIHWATGPLVQCLRIFYVEVTHLGGSSERAGRSPTCSSFLFLEIGHWRSASHTVEVPIDIYSWDSNLWRSGTGTSRQVTHLFKALSFMEIGHWRVAAHTAEVPVDIYSCGFEFVEKRERCGCV